MGRKKFLGVLVLPLLLSSCSFYEEVDGSYVKNLVKEIDKNGAIPKSLSYEGINVILRARTIISGPIQSLKSEIYASFTRDKNDNFCISYVLESLTRETGLLTYIAPFLYVSTFSLGIQENERWNISTNSNNKKYSGYGDTIHETAASIIKLSLDSGTISDDNFKANRHNDICYVTYNDEAGTIKCQISDTGDFFLKSISISGKESEGGLSAGLALDFKLSEYKGTISKPIFTDSYLECYGQPNVALPDLSSIGDIDIYDYL